MTTADKFIQHGFGGGFATDFGPTTNSAPNQAGQIVIPFLVDAENVFFELDGGPHKIPGTEKINGAAFESGAQIRGVYDYWQTGTAGSPSQHRILHVSTVIKKDDGDGTFTDLFTGLQDDALPDYTTFDDILIIGSDASDVPRSWDGTTAQNLAGTPPNFSVSVAHKNRAWAIGVNTNRSRLYYSVLLDPEDWIGSGSGSIDIDPDDGDSNTAIISHKDDLWVFKGPYKGSIHRITGSAPTGSDAFARKPFISGVGAVAQRLVFRYRDDIGFVWSDGTVRSLSVTAEFGDMREASLSGQGGINNYLRDNIVFSSLKKGQTANDDVRGVVLFGLPVGGSSEPNQVLAMDYRFNPVRWSLLPAFGDNFGPTSMASVIDSANSDQRNVFLGGNDGFLRRSERSDRSIDGSTAISYKVTTPFLNYGVPHIMKSITDASLGLSPKNDGSLTFGWSRDNSTQQTTTVTQGGTDVLGTAAANQFTLGTSTLGGGQFVDRFMQELSGEFRAIQYQVTNSVNSEDVEVHTIGSSIQGGGFSTEN